MNDTTKKLDDFGEVIHGAKKHNFADLDLTNADTRKLPFSKLWAKSEIDAIEDVTVAAIAHHIRSSLPAKPRKPLAQKNWFVKLENAQTTVAWLVARPESAKTLIEKLEAGGWNDRAGAFAIQMMAQTDRKHWDKLAFDIRGNSFLVRAGDENHKYSVADVRTANIAEAVAAMKPAIAEALANFQEAPSKQKELQFSVYRNTATNEIFIAVKSDKHKTPLINFDTVAEARNYLRNEDADIRRENVENLYQLWQEHKELNNIVKADMRSAENTARTGIGYRDGRDITPEEFLQTFNVRGGQFGNWVRGDERQIHLNHAYDAFMDLSKAANIPPSAIGLNGELGIAFGARGSGWAAAHYETQHKVINLTKTKGAGSLAHEWWHALDHYLGDNNLATRNITTIRPENMRHAELSTPLQALLKATSITGLQQRSIKADSYRSKAYFGTKAEMTARAFEKYVANKLEGHGIRNDYLVNIIKFSDWQRNSDAYVYPKDDELEAFSQAYDHVFEKLAEVDKSFQREVKASEQALLVEKEQSTESERLINDYMTSNGFVRNDYGLWHNHDLLVDINPSSISISYKDSQPIQIHNGNLDSLDKIHSAFIDSSFSELHSWQNPSDKQAEKTANQASEFGQSADASADSEAENVLPPQHPVKIPADDKGSKLGSSKSDEYLQKIADRILEQVKNNEAPWQKPFEAGTIHNVLPVSGASGKTYQSLNLINLMATAAAKGYDDNRWFTYNNAQEAGGQVRRGEKGTQIHFWHIPTKEDVEKEQTKADAEGREPKNLSPKLRIYTVFNAEQIDGLPERQLNETLLTKFERHEKAEAILENSGVRIEHTHEKTGYYSANYNARNDTITLPQRELFASEDAYYATALHELAHATGHESRLNRDLTGAFGSYSYAKEELRAEIASMMIGQELQIGHDPTNHYAYLQSWAAVIENDPKEFFKATKDADLITNYVLDLEKIAEVEQQKEAEKTAQQEIPASQANITAENRRLFVPYEQKDVASALGARWDKDNKAWYAPAGSDLDKFKPWLKEPVREFARPEDEFARQLEAHGLRLESGHPIMDGQWHRLKVDGDRTGKSGAYIGHLDGVPRGTVKNFKTGQETNWTAKDAVVKSVPSSLDIERAKAAAEAKQKASYNQAADAAKLVLSKAQPAKNHPYLDKKDVAAHGLYIVPDKSVVNLDNTNLAIANDWREAKAMRESFKAAGIEKQVLTKGDLIVPAINEHGDLRTFQMISGNDGSFKSFVKGGEKSGSYYVIGDLNNAKDVIIAEGYATAATLHEKTAKPVVVAFDAGNLSTVAEKVRATLPDVRIYIAADNDHNNSVNTGVEKANSAAEKVDAKVIVPKFDKLDDAEKLSDWNDLHKANPHDFVAQLAKSEMGRQDFADKLANLSPEHQEVFKGWYDYINDKLANLPEIRNAKQASLEQEVKKAEQGLSNLPSVADYQAQQAAKKQAAQVVTQQPTQQATVAIQAPAADTTTGKGKGGFER